MDDRCIHMLCLDLRYGAYLCMIHDDGITLDMGMALVLSDGSRMEHLRGMAFSDRSGNDLGSGAASVHGDFYVGFCFLFAICHQPFQHKQLCVCIHGHVGLTHRGIDTLDLYRIQREYRILSQFNIGHGIQDPAAGAVSLAVMLLFITHIGIFSHMEGMDPVMAALITAAVVDPAAGDDRHICSIFNIKVIVYQIRHSGNTHHHRNINLLRNGRSINKNIDARLVFFLLYLDMFTVPVTKRDSVLAEIESSALSKSRTDLVQYLLCDRIQLYHQFLPPSSPVIHFWHFSC